MSDLLRRAREVGGFDDDAVLISELADEIVRLRVVLKHIADFCSIDEIPHPIRSYRAMREAKEALKENDE